MPLCFSFQVQNTKWSWKWLLNHLEDLFSDGPARSANLWFAYEYPNCISKTNRASWNKENLSTWHFEKSFACVLGSLSCIIDLSWFDRNSWKSCFYHRNRENCRNDKVSSPTKTESMVISHRSACSGPWPSQILKNPIDRDPTISLGNLSHGTGFARELWTGHKTSKLKLSKIRDFWNFLLSPEIHAVHRQFLLAAQNLKTLISLQITMTYTLLVRGIASGKRWADAYLV